jgi:tetratricopeptide (TPR) repeat protein
MDTIIEMGSNLSKNYLYRGSLKQSAGRHDIAMADINKAIELDENIADAYVKRGISEFELGKFNEAITDLDLGIAKKSWQDSIAYRYRGQSNQSLGNFDEALRDYNAALKYNSRDVTLISYKASVYMAMGEEEKGLDLIEIALKIERNYIEAIKQNSVLSNADNQNLQRVLELALEYNKFHPENPQNNLNIGFIYGRIKQPETSLKYLNTVTGPLANSYDCHYNKAMAYFYMLDNERAILSFKEAIKQKSNAGMAYIYMADCYKMTGNKDSACTSLETASKLGVLGAQELFDEMCK